MLQLQNIYIVWAWYCLWFLDFPTLQCFLPLSTVATYVHGVSISIIFLYMGFTDIQRTLLQYRKYSSCCSHGFWIPCKYFRWKAAKSGLSSDLDFTVSYFITDAPQPQSGNRMITKLRLSGWNFITWALQSSSKDI